MPGHPGKPPAAPASSRTAAARTRTRLLALFCAVALVIAATIVLAVVKSGPPAGNAAVPQAAQRTPVAAAPDSLEEKIDAVISDAGDYRVGVALSDISGDAALTFGDTDLFTAASTAKIITAAAYYHLVENGEAALDEPMGDYDAAFQLESMVNESNNDSWLLLMDAVGYPRLTDYAASIGVTYDPGKNVLTPADMALVLKQLYAGKLLNAENTAELLGYMQDTNNEDLIPAGSRSGIEVHHKYGELGGDLHDAAILNYRGSTFALVVFTENADGTEDPAQAETIRDITRTVEDALFPLAPAGA